MVTLQVIKAQAQQAKRADKYEYVVDEDTDNDVMDKKPQKENSHNKRTDGKVEDDEDTDDDSRHTSTNGSSGAEYSLIHSRRGNIDATSSSVSTVVWEFAVCAQYHQFLHH